MIMLMKKIILWIFYIIAFIFGICMIELLFDYNPCYVNIENKFSLLSALGIIISAFIASLSVLISIENSKNLEKEKRKTDKCAEVNRLKLKTSILREMLLAYFRENSIDDKDLNKSKISDCKIGRRDERRELLLKLDSYEEFVDGEIKVILNGSEILEDLKKVIKNITIVRAEEILKENPVEKAFTIHVSVEKALIHDLEELEIRLEKFHDCDDKLKT